MGLYGLGQFATIGGTEDTTVPKATPLASVSLVGPKGLLTNEFSRAKGSLPQDRLR